MGALRMLLDLTAAVDQVVRIRTVKRAGGPARSPKRDPRSEIVEARSSKEERLNRDRFHREKQIAASRL